MTITDVLTECRSLVDATTASYTDPLLLIRTNTAIEEIVDLILTADGRWRKLLPFDPDDLTNPLLDRAQFLNVSGMPYYGRQCYGRRSPRPDSNVLSKKQL